MISGSYKLSRTKRNVATLRLPAISNKFQGLNMIHALDFIYDLQYLGSINVPAKRPAVCIRAALAGVKKGVQRGDDF